MHQAFVLGAGLGTRLRPLTDLLPKPLIPVAHQPLAAWAFDHLRHAGVRRFVVNTHHLPDKWHEAFPDGSWQGCPVAFNHEPVLLETGGGLADVAGHLGDEPFLVYNGDVLTDLPLARAIAEHRRSGNLVTLILRSAGDVRNVALDRASGRVIDLRNALGTSHPDQFQFTGIYAVEPAFLRYVQRGVIESVVPAFLCAIQAGERIGGAVIDDGEWRDLGDRRSYLDAHQMLARGGFPSWNPQAGLVLPPVHPEAEVSRSARVADSWIGPGAVIEEDAVVESSVLWPGARVRRGARLSGCIVRTGRAAEGRLADTDV